MSSVWNNLHRLSCRNIFLVFFISTHGLPIYSQSGYYYFDVDAKNGSAKNFHRPQSDKLSALLIDGYLKGKITGYRYNIGGDILKKVGARYYFPTMSDTLSKMEFLHNMIYKLPYILAEWSPDVPYHKGDLVQYQESQYECTHHGTKGKLPTDKEYWNKLYSTTEIHSTQLEGTRILMYREKVGNQVAHWPQMICPMSMDFDDYGTEIGLAFYYSDVLKYLATVAQPMLYQNGVGYVGDQLFILDSQNHEFFDYWLRSSLKSGTIRAKNNSIVNSVSFDLFVQDTIKRASESRAFDSPWETYQDLVSNDIVINEIYLDKKQYKRRIVARLPIQDVERGTPAKSIPLSFSTWLTSFNFTDPTIGPIELNIDSLSPLKVISEPIQPTTNHFFILSTNCEPTDNPSVVKGFPEVWTAVAQAFKEKHIQFKNRLYTFYQCQYNWPSKEIVINGRKWNCPPGFNLAGQAIAAVDSLVTTSKLNSFSITYKKWLANQSTKLKFEPIQITLWLEYQVKPSSNSTTGSTDKRTTPVKNNVYYTLDWTDLKKVLTKKTPVITSFINAVEKGELKYYNSFVDYGLIEDK